MPKIIENVRENLIEEARRQIRVSGYAGMTIRSVAKACLLGVGTVYNYFRSKEELVHAAMHKDWKLSVERIRICSESTDDPETLLRCMYDELSLFIKEHGYLISDTNATKVFAQVYATGHSYLREQLAEFLKTTCDNYAQEPSELLPEFLAEAILTWTSVGKPFEEIYALQKIHFK
ncbi:MAG: TetR/AcrR family transcriptional regulator [Clostridia bacterium]|nr:TetR/AcrR family transcriptional regulator [Clostridia bacterium]